VKSDCAADRFVRFLLVAFAAVGLCFLPTIDALSVADDLVVKTTSGRVRGIVRHGSGAEFLGIPFAQPPIGELRWREPQPVKAWDDVPDAFPLAPLAPKRYWESGIDGMRKPARRIACSLM
jgi:hypothetical protein